MTMERIINTLFLVHRYSHDLPAVWALGNRDCPGLPSALMKISSRDQTPAIRT